MLHHEESPEKPQYNMAAPPPFLPPPHFAYPPPPFLAKIFRPPISINVEKVDLPFMLGGWGMGGGGSNYGSVAHVNANLQCNHLERKVSENN